MFEPVKAAFGEFMGGYYRSLAPTTKPMHEYVNRGLDKSIAWAPSRMVDAIEDMLASWQRNDTDSAPTRPAKMPVVFVAMARDLSAPSRDFTTQVADELSVIIPGDPKERHFKLRTLSGEIRTQVAFCAEDEPTVKSLAAQFGLWLDSPVNRRFYAGYTFAGIAKRWPVQIEDPGMVAMGIQTDSKNKNILAVDVTLRVTVPLFSAPKDGEPNDGKGTGPDDPSGYPLVVAVDTYPGELA
ncbi:hypothetical protein [Pusillimonas noertemannii]|uniref:Uncharacterized protein n=1 Tax=Pusillimonas noertemannii TaxID=305977 RepID=A0A2U1CMH0_9BURK|nr:hypothetical protein [Pusillimonas noertemannii]NYT68789.1 hypothetical protein [Pusillimonas noertemannii]PVY62187.1 hypothetical protein C7440_1680 [Pusillimonas noertemannii]TFL10825.1 hypothetical protein CSC72_09955 [Pusillimonas noertemannii]